MSIASIVMVLLFIWPTLLLLLVAEPVGPTEVRPGRVRTGYGTLVDGSNAISEISCHEPVNVRPIVGFA
jgi:hypothetical protein